MDSPGEPVVLEVVVVVVARSAMWFVHPRRGTTETRTPVR